MPHPAFSRQLHRSPMVTVSSGVGQRPPSCRSTCLRRGLSGSGMAHHRTRRKVCQELGWKPGAYARSAKRRTTGDVNARSAGDRRAISPGDQWSTGVAITASRRSAPIVSENRTIPKLTACVQRSIERTTGGSAAPIPPRTGTLTGAIEVCHYLSPYARAQLRAPGRTVSATMIQTRALLMWQEGNSSDQGRVSIR
jgi:hypothetical protein